MFFKGKEKPVIPEIDTPIRVCVNDDCHGWMREEFVSEDELCPLCGSSTQKETKILPQMQKEPEFYRK